MTTTGSAELQSARAAALAAPGLGTPKSANQRLVLLATSISYILVVVDTSIVNIGLVRIGAAFSTGVTGLQWVVNSYTLIFASLLLAAGALGDRWGPKRVYTAGLFTFTAASALCAGAISLEMLLLGRILQGVGAALLVASSLSLLNNAYAAQPVLRAKAIGLWASCGGVALAASPVLGGFLIDSGGWRAIFLVNVPIGVAGILITANVAADYASAAGHRFDLPGQFAIIAFFAVTIAVLIEGPELRWLSPVILAGCGAALASGGLFLLIEARQPQPMLPLAIFGNARFSGATIIALAGQLSFAGMLFVLSIYFQKFKHYTPFEVGLGFLPLTIAVTFGNILFSRFAKTVAPRAAIIAGSLVQITGLLALLTLGPESSYAAQLMPLLLMGLGGGLRAPASATAMMASIDKAQSGITSGVLNSARQMGASVGVAICGSLIAGTEWGLEGAIWVSTGASLASIAAAIQAFRESGECRA